jgi:hypothetical protein
MLYVTDNVCIFLATQGVLYVKQPLRTSYIFLKCTNKFSIFIMFFNIVLQKIPE